MDDYISREDAVNVVANTAKIVASFNYQYAIDALLALTPADVVPVVHARWNQLDNGGFVCSACMGGYKVQPTLMGKPMFEYCPICGAKMDGGKS